MHQLLIVDDQPDLVEDLSTMLPWDTIGIGRIHTACSAAEALDILYANPVDIVITDIRMPGMSGLDLVEQIRETWPAAQCILLSGYDDFQYAKRALKSKALDYLLKPVEDDELLGAARRAVQALEAYWSEVASRQSAMRTMKTNLPVLRSHLLEELMSGRRIAEAELAGQLELLELPLRPGMPFHLLLVRMEDYFTRQTPGDAALLEYALTNMAADLFGGEDGLWHTKDACGYLVLLIGHQAGHTNCTADVESKAAQLQHVVRQYLKGTISLLVSRQATFPDDLHELYELSLSQFRQQIGSQRELLLTGAGRDMERGEASSLQQLYTPPLLTHLLEAGQWEGLTDKLETVFEELEHRWGDSHEHILETYFAVAGSLSYAVHKNRHWMADTIGGSFQQLLEGPGFHTIGQLREWALEAVTGYRHYMENRAQNSRSTMVQRVQEYVTGHLAEATLQSIAAHVFLNPSYLSKVYKIETGEGISEYLSRRRLELAAHMLRSGHEKIYQIAAAIGYQKTSYFIKVFKERYGMTPQEYRDS